MSETEKIGYEKDGRTAVITLQRPETRNAIDPEMDRRLQEIWSDFRDDDDLDLQ
jgi:enoyl-CoA hydratase/carnithine racemase